MHEQLRAINEYYDILEYNESNKKKALMEISILSKGIKFKDIHDVSKRFLETASAIEENLFLFKSACEHIDIVTTIIEYLTNFGVKFMFGENKYDRDEIILSVIFTVFNICREREVQLFLENAIIRDSRLNKIRYKHLKGRLLDQTNEMILLEDSDLYAIISDLMIIDSSRLNKIWVQEAIKEKFLSLIKKYFHHKNFSIHAFRSKQDLLTPNISYNMNIASVWSEDVVAARNLATFLNKDVLFINMHMDLCGGIVLLPYTDIFEKMLDNGFKFRFDDSAIRTSENDVSFLYTPGMEPTSIYNLFYDGMWRKPVKGMYWKYNGTLWASATSYDINKCINSAEKGFKIWSTRSTDSRMQTLFNFASVLECNGKFPLADIISKWIKAPHICENELLCSRHEKLEITEIRKPKGIIILKAECESILFFRLIQILMAGNCVIVIFNANSCSLAPYCDMISTSQIPPGVINLLSKEDTNDLELSLCATDYANYEKQLFSEDDPEKTYLNLTVCKQIIFPLK